MAKKLTQRYIDSLEPPESSWRAWFDSEVGGFGIRITSGGSRSFIYQYRNASGRKRRITLGGYPGMTPTAAREKALRYRERIRDGKDPLAEKESFREELTLDALAEEYIQSELVGKKSRSESERLIKTDILRQKGNPLRPSRNAVDLKRSDIRNWFKARTAKAPVAANRALKVLRRIYTWASQQDKFGDDVTLNPTTGIKLNREGPNPRYLEENEIRDFLEKVDGCWKLGQPVADALRLTLFTAQRSGEVVAMDWDEVDLGQQVWKQPKEKTKNGVANTVPLNGLAADVLKQRKANRERGEARVFPGRGQNSLARALNRKDEKGVYVNRRHLGRWCEKDPFTPHSLRHTAITWLSELGVTRLVISKIVNHKDRTITGHYDHSPRTNEKKQAMARWDDKLQEIITGKKQKVVSIG